jgi:hypothetical protein
MLPAALEQERLLLAERLLSEIQRRHGLPETHQHPLSPSIVDRFLAAYLPESGLVSPPHARSSTPSLRL